MRRTRMHNLLKIGGEGGDRTHGPVARTAVFETARFGHSRTSPQAERPQIITHVPTVLQDEQLPLKQGCCESRCEMLRPLGLLNTYSLRLITFSLTKTSRALELRGTLLVSPALAKAVLTVISVWLTWVPSGRRTSARVRPDLSRPCVWRRTSFPNTIADVACLA